MTAFLSSSYRNPPRAHESERMKRSANKHLLSGEMEAFLAVESFSELSINGQLNVAFILGQHNLTSFDEFIVLWESSEEKEKIVQSLNDKLSDIDMRLLVDSVEIMKKRSRIGTLPFIQSVALTNSYSQHAIAGEMTSSSLPSDLSVLLEELRIKDEVSSFLQARGVQDLATLFNSSREELTSLPIRKIPLKKLLKVYDDYHGIASKSVAAPEVDLKDTVYRVPYETLLDTPAWKHLNLDSLPKEQVMRFFYKKAVKTVRDLGRLRYKEPSRLERLIADFTISFPTVSVEKLKYKIQSAVDLYKQAKGFSCSKSVKFEKTVPPPPAAAAKGDEDDTVFEAVLKPSYPAAIHEEESAKMWNCRDCFTADDASFKSCVACGFLQPDPVSVPYTPLKEARSSSASSSAAKFVTTPTAAKARCCLTSICMNDDPTAVDDMFQLNCDHFFHLDCFAGYVRHFTESSRLGQNKVDYRCPECVRIGYGCLCWDCNMPGLSESDDCCYDDCSTSMVDMSMSVSMKAEPHVITYDEVKNLIKRCNDNGDHVTLNETHLGLMQRILLPAAEEGVLVITCRCGNLFEALARQAFGVCPNCKLDMCFSCGEPQHNGQSCEEMNMVSLEEALGVSQYCIGCDMLIEYESGCKHFTCSNCSEQFCFVCSAPHIPTLYHGQSYHRPKCELYKVCCDKKCLEGAAATCVEDRYLPGPCPACRNVGSSCEQHNRCEHSAWRACSFCVDDKKACKHWCLACEKCGSLCSRPRNMRMLKGREVEAKFNSLTEMAEAEKEALAIAGKRKAASSDDLAMVDAGEDEEALKTVEHGRNCETHYLDSRRSTRNWCLNKQQHF